MKMFSKFATLTVFAATVAMASLAQAQQVAAVNVQRVVSEVKELKDLDAKWKARAQEIQTQGQQRQARINELKNQRDQFKAGSAEYDRAAADLSKTFLEAQIATQFEQQNLVREQKRTLKTMYDKVAEVVKAVAADKKIGVVIAQNVPPELSEDNFDRLTPEQVEQLVRSRNILYVAPEADLTTEVITRMDANYSSGR